MTTIPNSGQNSVPSGLPYNAATSTASARQKNAGASQGTTSTGTPGTTSSSAGASGQQNTPSAQAPHMRQVGQKGQSAQIIAALTTLGYSFRMNDLIGDVEVNGEVLTDGLMAEIRTLMRDAAF